MKVRRWGCISNYTTNYVKRPVENLILSNSLRAGVTGFARTLANEGAPAGITVNNILPGYTPTERTEELAAVIAAHEGIRAAGFIRLWGGEIPRRRLRETRSMTPI